MSKAGLKAGVIGAAIVAVLQLVGLIPIPCVGCFICLLGWAVYVGAGALAAYWLPVPRSAGDGAGAGAIAGVVTGLVGGIFGMIASGLQYAMFGGREAMMQGLDAWFEVFPEMQNSLLEMGLSTDMLASIEFTLASRALCCIGGMVIAAVLGAIGGVIFASTQSE